jgi:hypothetical protein
MTVSAASVITGVRAASGAYCEGLHIRDAGRSHDVLDDKNNELGKRTVSDLLRSRDKSAMPTKNKSQRLCGRVDTNAFGVTDPFYQRAYVWANEDSEKRCGMML